MNTGDTPLKSLFQRETDGDDRPAGQALPVFSIGPERGAAYGLAGRIGQQAMTTLKDFYVAHRTGIIQRHPKLHQPGNARPASLERIDRTAETREGRAAGLAERNIRPSGRGHASLRRGR